MLDGVLWSRRGVDPAFVDPHPDPSARSAFHAV